MAHKKGAGSSRNGRESHSKRLGIKIFGGQSAIAGNIIVRQRGTPHHPDKNVGIGKDHTLFALIDGTVMFKKKADNKSYVSILPRDVVTAEVAAPIKEKKAVSASEVIEAPVAEKKAVKSEKPIAAEAAAQRAKEEEVAEAETTEASKTKEPVAAKEPAKKEEVKKEKVAEPESEPEMKEEPATTKKPSKKEETAEPETEGQTPSEELL